MLLVSYLRLLLLLNSWLCLLVLLLLQLLLLPVIRVGWLLLDRNWWLRLHGILLSSSLVELILSLLLLSSWNLLCVNLLRGSLSLVTRQALMSLIVLPLLVLVLLLLQLRSRVLGHLHLDLFNLIGEGWLHGQRADGSA